jgi:hypothetical protein
MVIIVFEAKTLALSMVISFYIRCKFICTYIITSYAYVLAPFYTYTSFDEDMASTHMTMLGELHGGQGDQQVHPNREEGPKLIRFESPRWRPKSSSSPPRNPGPVFLELVTQDVSGLCFR